MKPQGRGWALWELVLGLILLGVFAALAARQFNRLRSRARESALKGDLGLLRSALLLYYGDNGGAYPLNLEALARDKKYISAIPVQDVLAVEAQGNPGHRFRSPSEEDYDAFPADSQDVRRDGEALWGYVNLRQSPHRGHVFINCVHKDTKSVAWKDW